MTPPPFLRSIASILTRTLLNKHRQLQARRKSLQGMVLPPVLQRLPQREQERVRHRQVRRRGLSAVDVAGEGQ